MKTKITREVTQTDENNIKVYLKNIEFKEYTSCVL